MSQVPVLAAPTASGKTAAALELAKQLPLEVISADAMQVYKGMDIGTAKPSLEERAALPHHLIDVVAPDEPFSVADFARLAEAAIGEVLARGKTPLVVGGTGFYIRALSEGLPTVPPAAPERQRALWEVFKRGGLEPLLAELERFSPQDAARAQRNPRRVVRALEIVRFTGRPPSAFPKTTPKYQYRKLALLPSAEVLTPRIEARVEGMFTQGLVAEVTALSACYPEQPTAMQAIGYKEVLAHLKGQLTLDEAKEAVKLATVKYAKRQRTWLRKEPGAHRLEGLADAVLDELLAWLIP